MTEDINMTGIKKDKQYKMIYERAKKLKETPTTCIYCGFNTNLLALKPHNKTKKCLYMKELFFKDPDNIKNGCSEYKTKIQLNMNYNKINNV